MENTKKWAVVMFVKGYINAEVEAASAEEAKNSAWDLYHNGEVNDDLEWDVDDIEVSEIVFVSKAKKGE